MAQPGSSAASEALGSNTAAASFATAHSELFREQLTGDPAATVAGCFPPLAELPEARVWKLLGVLASLYAELAVVSKDELHIFRVRDRPFYESLLDCSEADLADMKTVVDYLLLPKPLLEAMETNVKVEACKQAYQAALAAFELVSAREAKPTLLAFVQLDGSLRARMEAVFRRFGEVQDTFGPYFREILASDSIFGFIVADCDGTVTARQAIFDGLMGEPISEYGYPPSPLRLQTYAAMCVVMERPIPWDLLPSPLSFRDWIDWRVPHMLSPVTTAAGFNRIPAFDDILAHGIDISKPWSSVIDAAVLSGSLEILGRIRTAAPHAFDLSTRESVKAAESLLHVVCNYHHDRDVSRWLLHNCDMGQLLADTTSNKQWLLAFAAAADDVELLQRCHAAGCPVSSLVIDNACANGSLEVLQWAIDHGAGWSSSSFGLALATDKLDFVWWALDHGCPFPEDNQEQCWSFPRQCLIAIASDLAVLEMLVARGLRLHSFTLTRLAKAAASIGRLDALQWAQSQPSSRFTDVESPAFDQVLIEAIESEQRSCVEWMMGFLGAVKPVDKDGKPRVLVSSRRFRGKGSAWASKATTRDFERLAPYYDLYNVHEFALYTRDLALARWLLERGFPPRDAQVRAVCVSETGALPFLQLYADEGSIDLRRDWWMPWGMYEKLPTCALVARGGSVAMMEYVRSKGCEWDNSVLIHAATHGQLPMLKWLRTQQPAWPWPEGLVKQARHCASHETAAWAAEHGATS